MTMQTTRPLRVDASSAEALATVRSILFVATLALSWITVKPFVSLADPSLATLGDNSDVLNQFAYVLLAGTVLIFFLMHEPSRLRRSAPAYFAMMAVCRHDRNLPPFRRCRRRLIFCFTVVVLAASVAADDLPAVLRPARRDRGGDPAALFRRGRADTELSIHQASDVAEPGSPAAGAASSV